MIVRRKDQLISWVFIYFLNIETMIDEFHLLFKMANYLNSFSVHHSGVHLKDCVRDRPGWRQFGHADVDGVGTLWVQHDDLFALDHFLLFLNNRNNQS